MNWRYLSRIQTCTGTLFVVMSTALIGDFQAAATEREKNEVPSRAGVATQPRSKRLSNQPLYAIRDTAALENEELDLALEKFSRRTSRDDFGAITDFLRSYPSSGWRASLLSELGEEYYKTGHFSKALASWEQAWQERSLTQTNTPMPLPVQHAAASLANLYARLGRMETLRHLLHDIEGMAVMGQYATKLEDARQGLWTMDHRPEIAFRCGPLALDRIRAWGHPTNACNPLVFNSRSTTNGICLTEVAKLSRDLGMDYQIAFRSPGAKVIVPSLIHWKVGHYAALVRETHGLFLAQDPTFWDDTFASEPTLDEEASGYFLVPAGPLPKGWRTVANQEAGKIWGKGATRSSDQRATRSDDEPLKKDPCKGMAIWDFNLMLVNQRISDMPIGYRPPVGPPVEFTFTMSAQDNWMRQFASWWGTTLGENWSCNWNSFIQDDPSNPSGNLQVYDEGGFLTFMEDPAQPGVFRCEFHNPGYITRVSTNGMNFGYIWNLPDGGRKAYATRYSASGSTTGFSLMSAVVDPQGNAVTLEYDANFPGRIMAIVDAIGQRTTLEYGLSDPGFPPPSPISQGNLQFNWQVTKITDPFGRSATFQYEVVQDGSPPAYFYYLTNITDVAGLNSQVKFDPGWAISSFPVMRTLTTPYGTTLFSTFVLGNRDFGFEITGPDGNVERLQYSENPYANVPATELQQNVPRGLTHAENAFLFARNVYYWDKKAYAEGFSKTTNDYSKAVIYHFTHAENITACGPILESLKRPLENRIWFNYPGQGAGWWPGTDDRPSKIGRVLDDSTTQLWSFLYNTFGNITNSVDPMGRTFSFIYDTNDIDLLEIRQTRNGNNELFWKATYNNQHQPTTITDATGQTTTYTYNPRGQTLTVANARNETNTFTYDANGYLTSIDGPLPGPQDRDTFTYDTAGRVRTATDQDGYTVTFDHDNLDRLTKMTFPDGTYQQTTYDRLKPGTFRDRLGRVTTYSYTSLGQLASIEDPAGRLTRFQWCRCGDLEAMIDPMGRMTSWQRDLQGRITAKQYADGSTVHYDYERTTSRLRDIRDEQNQITQFDYFADDSLRKKSYLNAAITTPSIQYTYDPNYFRVLAMQDGQGVTTYTYNPILGTPSLGAGHIASITGPWLNDTITFQYDELGRTISRAIGPASVKRVYDAAGRMTQLTNILGAFTLTWEGGSERLSSLQYPNGQHTGYGYSPNAQDQMLQRITNYRPDNSVQSEFTYQYNPEGTITNLTQSQAGVLSTWLPDYDANDRLLRVSVFQGGSAVQTFSYGYDPADNRAFEQVNSSRSDAYFNSLNQMVALNNSPVGLSAYEWDAENRLTAITNGNHRTEFSYDGYGRRVRIVEKDGGNVTNARRYVWCGMQLCEERDDSGSNVLRRFSSYGQASYDPTVMPVGNYYVTSDHLSSIREMNDSTGALRAQYWYNPFGQRTRVGGDLESGFGFTGLFLHQPSSLLLAVFRAYDTRLGRWLSRDPAGEAEGPNRYAYVRNSPLDFIDPTGFGDQPAFGKLVNQTQSGKDVQEAIDTAKSAKKVVVTTKSIIEKGATETLENEMKSQKEKALQKLTPEGDRKELEQIYDENGKTSKTIEQGTVPFKGTWKKANEQLSGQTPCPEKKSSGSDPSPKPEHHFWDSFFGSDPDPSQPQAMDKGTANKAQNAANEANVY